MNGYTVRVQTESLQNEYKYNDTKFHMDNENEDNLIIKDMIPKLK